MNGLALQGWCINTCKDKANEIMAAAKVIHADAILRVVSPDVHSEDGMLQESLSTACATCTSCYSMMHSADASAIESCCPSLHGAYLDAREI